MIVDGATDAAAPLLDRIYDVCIAGAGFAGITLARRLAQAGRDVILLEAGGLDFDEESQAVYAGRNIGHRYFPLDETRLRYFGGTSNHTESGCLTRRLGIH